MLANNRRIISIVGISGSTEERYSGGQLSKIDCRISSATMAVTSPITLNTLVAPEIIFRMPAQIGFQVLFRVDSILRHYKYG